MKSVLKRKEMRGAIIGLAGMMAAFGMASNVSESINERNAVYEEVTNEGHIAHSADIPLAGFGVGIDPSLVSNSPNVDVSDVNKLNLIINDNKCSSNFFNEVCEKLQEDGLEFTTSQNCEGVDVDNSVVISLDQLYLSGPGMQIFCPYDNERLGESDALALAMETTFLENGFELDGVFAGKIGYRQSKLGSFQSRVPTATEDAIGTDKNTTFVTASFGTNNVEVEDVAKSIEDALARYVYYLREKNDVIDREDLIYRVEGGNTMDNVTKRFSNVSSEDVNSYNDLDKNNSNFIYIDDTLRNPHNKYLDAFDKDFAIKLDVTRVNKY